MNDKNNKKEIPYTVPVISGYMSKRLYIATMAMQGLLANPNIKRPDGRDEKGNIEFSNVCYQYADELLKQENNE